LRIGKASDVNPACVPNVIARKQKEPVPLPIFPEGIYRPRNRQPKSLSLASVENGDEYAVTAQSDDPVRPRNFTKSLNVFNFCPTIQFDVKIAAITTSLRDRMRFYKLKVTPNAANITSTFNKQFIPEIIQDHNDPFNVDWITDPSDSDEVFVGEKVEILQSISLDCSL